MKKILSLAIIFCFILGGIGAVAIQPTKQIDIKSINSEIRINENQLKIIEEKNEYLKLSLEDEQSYLLNPGKPILPKKVQTFELPFGATNINVKVSPIQTTTTFIEKEIKPSPSPLPLSSIEHVQNPIKKDLSIYQSTNPYPSDSYKIDIGVGINEDFEHVTFVTIHFYPIKYTPVENKLTITEKADIKITFTQPENNVLPETTTYDLVIIAPNAFSDALQPLVDHKNSYGVNTFIKTVEDIYTEFPGVDKAEQIKYFIKDAIEEYNIKYVLLAGGLKSTLYAKPRDNKNIGESGWHVPVRYSNVKVGGDPGYPSDLYYADIYKQGGEFETWDYDGDGIFAEWPDDSGAPRDIADLRPDVAVGRLASSDAKEISEVVNKIIYYETTTYGSDWFEKMVVYSGDGFLDQFDLDIQWDTNNITDGEYTICAQSFNDEGESGPVDEITVTVDKSVKSVVTFNHDDHLNPIFENGYPAPPIAEIVSVSKGNILGNTDVMYTPSEGEAYCNSLFWWANVSYVNQILTIRGKSYDPKPYGNITNIKVWVKNSDGEEVFSTWRNNTPMYYEGEWVTGEKSLNGRGGALYYMPEDFEKEILWTSNGKFTGMKSVMNTFDKGSGFAFFSGHGSPGYWGDQTPGIPGNRGPASVDGLVVSNLQSLPPFITDTPIWPMKALENTGKLPITVVGGCHNSLFNVSLIPAMFQYYNLLLFKNNNFMWTYFQAVPQCWSWYLVQLPNTGAIATMGNTGLGWGWEGEFCTIGAGDGWISSEFFRQYGEHYGENGFEKLGQVYTQTQTSYVNTFKDFTLPESWWLPDTGWDAIDQQAVEQWVLLGDPSLQIGGYQ